ncbi:MAG TPA: hypothetical protein VKV39_01575 [Candidatus Sulfotelmatobacter sp.]|nr:hypothetical protein [Candidatus Sulfotelmatobacter sp.]
MTDPTRSVSLPEDLCAALESRFGDVQAFLSFIMREVLRDDALALDKNEERIVEQRLRDLGYL